MLAEGEESGLPELEAAIENRNYASYNFSVTGPVTSPITDEEHKANVRKGIAHCMRGDVFQIVLSRRFIQPYTGDDFKVYRALRSINPSPYLSISISEDIESSVLHRKHTARLKATMLISIRLPEQHAGVAIS